jgi:hypothetical protein
MLRDICLFGNAGFRSDLDFVIDPWDPIQFREAMLAKGSRVNRFGGYALPSAKWKVEVWPLRQTWAHEAGHVKVVSFADVRRATFFSCDAILFDLSSRRLVCDDNYFRYLSKRLIEINLEPNPNPAGNVVRAFRYSAIKGFDWGPALAGFVLRALQDTGWRELREREVESFGSWYIDEFHAGRLEEALSTHVASGVPVPFSPLHYLRHEQLRLADIP